jgi:cytochrome d ubiquinol oxidase subunit I
MAFLDPNAYVPGIKDLIHGNPERNIISTTEKMERGKLAISALKEYKEAKKAGNQALADSAKTALDANFNHFGYGFLKDEHEAIPPIKLTFYSFRFMVGLGFLFVLLFIISLWLVLKNKTENKKWFYRFAIIMVPLAYLATQMGWIVAEVGRQPWIIQDVMPASAAVSKLSTGSVQLTFVLFAITFTILLIAEIKIMLNQINKGPKEGGNTHV